MMRVRPPFRPLRVSHANGAAIVGAASDAVTNFFNSDMSAEEGAALLADSIALAR
jgi:glucose/mannose transport system substrate-binding protein